MTQQQSNNPTGALRTKDAAAAIGCKATTLCRWANLRDERGAALRKARLARGWYSTARLREAGLIV